MSRMNAVGAGVVPAKASKAAVWQEEFIKGWNDANSNRPSRAKEIASGYRRQAYQHGYKSRQNPSTEYLLAA